MDEISGNEGLLLIQIKQTCDAKAVVNEEATAMYEAQNGSLVIEDLQTHCPRGGDLQGVDIVRLSTLGNS